MPKKIGACALCHEHRELCESHFLPKGLYRLLVIVSKTANKQPVRVVSGDRRQTSRQATHYLLCAECETRFDRNGENWMLRQIYRGRGVFRLRSLLEAVRPLHADENVSIYSAASVSHDAVNRLIYFSTSIFWRASVRDWWAAGKHYEAIALGPYQERIRNYLLGVAPFPENSVLSVFLSRLARPAIAFNFPDSTRVDGCHCHSLHVPGITFQLTFGKHSAAANELSILHPPIHPLFVTNLGDARLQRGVLKAMGKIAPRWAEYPLIEGVV